VSLQSGTGCVELELVLAHAGEVPSELLLDHHVPSKQLIHKSVAVRLRKADAIGHVKASVNRRRSKERTTGRRLELPEVTRLAQA
jgi:hypothetical protein